MEAYVGAAERHDGEAASSKAGWDRGLPTRVLRCFRPHWRQGVAALLCLVAEAALGLAPALVVKALIDYLTKPGARFGHMALLVGYGITASVVGGLMGVVESFLGANISQGVMFDLRGKLFERVLSQPISFFTASRTGDVMSRIGNDVNAIEDVVTDTALGVASNLIVLPTTLVLMFALDWKLAVVALVGLPAAILPARSAGRKSFQARNHTQSQVSKMTAYLQEVLGISGILLVKAFAKDRAERERFLQMNRDLRRLQMRRALISRWFSMLMTVLQTAVPTVLLLFGGYLVLKGDATVGTVITFVVVLTGRLYAAVTLLGNLHVDVSDSLALFQRIFAYLDIEPQIVDRPGSRPLTKVQGALTFEHVTFTYAPGLRPALEDVSFRVEPGQLVALVGPTGSGKSTLTYQVPRFHEPQQGRVVIDHHDVRDVTLESLGNHVGIVFQDTYLFHATLRENLLYACPGAQEEEILAAAEAAHLQELIDSLPDGYETIVGERGHRLSGGEKQRVAIARVILKDPRILILDEATSHLDTASEQLIQAALTPLFEGRTCLVVAHRLSTILAADSIVVLDRGKLAEQGTHADLLARGGLYADLYERQFQSQGTRVPQLEPA